MLSKFIKSSGCERPDDPHILVDLGSTYLIGNVALDRCAGYWNCFSGEGLTYSIDGGSYSPLTGYPVQARFVKFQCGFFNPTCCVSRFVMSVYEALITTQLSISVDKTIIAPNSQFTVSGNVKDQYNNPMKDQVVNIKIYKGDVLFSTASATADENGNFSKPISTVGWSPDTYRVEVVSDEITQSVNVAVAYMSAVKFDSTCIDTGLPCPADVYLDGTLRGTTPLTLDNIPVGEHSYKISKTGYRDATGVVNVQQGITAEVSIPLTPEAKGSLFFSSNPPGAEIYLAYHGQTPQPQDPKVFTPANITDIPVGFYDFILKLDGFKDYSGTIEVIEGSVSVPTADLIPNEGCVYFASNPQGAKIFVDNVDTGQVTPKLICGLSLGSHTYRLELASYKPVTGTVGIGAGEGRTVSEALIKEGAGAGTLLGIALLSVGILGAVIVSRRA